MKKYAKLFALILAVLTVGGCGAPETPDFGLVTDAITTDPDATRITAPMTPETTDVNVRTEDGIAYEYPETTVPVDDGSTRITFLAAGDNIIHENVFLDAKARAKAGQDYNFKDMYAGIAEFVKSADLAFINQETPICGDDEFAAYGYPNFNSPEAVGDTLVDIGFDVVNIANNHMLDMKEKGYVGTLDYWDEWADEVTLLGGYRNRADYENIRVVTEQGISIAFLSYTYGTNGMTLNAGSEMFIPLIDEAEIVSKIKEARKLADLVFVVMHWGQENWFQLSKEQVTLANAITEAGADVIIGMHPHVVQPVEWKTASDGSKTLVIYSLGNLISTQYDNYNMIGGMMTFDIVKDAFGNVYIENPIFNPTVTHYNKERLGLGVYLAENYTAELCALHGTPDYGKDKTWTLPYIRSIIQKNVDAQFLTKFFQ
ncbi:MAG: CapA family protein [Ruminococcaceae bacterium]|nr:CapA family protein [Oscillospiraceae bacterium]